MSHPARFWYKTAFGLGFALILAVLILRHSHADS